MNYQNDDVFDEIKDITAGHGPDACVDDVGMEAHGAGLWGWYDKTKQTLRMETDRPTALREAITGCGKGGVVSVAGVYGGYDDKIPMGAAFNKALTFRMGQTHVQRYMKPLLGRTERGDIDPSFVITHRLRLEDAPNTYRLFRDKQDRCIKETLEP